VSQSGYFQNKGNYNDSYMLSVVGLPPDWYTLTVYGPEVVAPDDGRYGTLNITPKAAGNYTFSVRVTSNSDPAVSDYVVLTLHAVNASSGYNVTTTYRWAYYNGTYAPIEQFRVAPGTTAQQSVYLSNTGSRPESYNVSVSGIPASWWTFALYGMSTVGPGEGRYGNVFITPTAAGNYTFTVTVRSNSDPSVYATQTYTMYVAGPAPPSGYNVTTTHRWAVYNGVSRPIEQFTIRPGTAVQQSVYLSNTGSRPDSYNVSVSGIPASWWTFTLYGASTVNPGEGRYGNVFITPTTAGNYTFAVTVRSNGDPSVSSAQGYTLYVR